MFWAAIYPFIPPATQKKVVFVKGSLEQKRKIFSEYIDLDQLETDYGGNVQFTYDFEKCVGSILWRVVDGLISFLGIGVTKLVCGTRNRSNVLV
jgi:hypothetical protein